MYFFGYLFSIIQYLFPFLLVLLFILFEFAFHFIYSSNSAVTINPLGVCSMLTIHTFTCFDAVCIFKHPDIAHSRSINVAKEFIFVLISSYFNMISICTRFGRSILNFSCLMVKFSFHLILFILLRSKFLVTIITYKNMVLHE